MSLRGACLVQVADKVRSDKLAGVIHAHLILMLNLEGFRRFSLRRDGAATGYQVDTL